LGLSRASRLEKTVFLPWHRQKTRERADSGKKPAFVRHAPT